MRQISLPLVAAVLFLAACTSFPTKRAPSQSTLAPTTIIAAATDSPPSRSRGYISFIINVHDWTHTNESADILIRLVDLLETENLRGDFYFTAEVTRAYAEQRPDVIERFKQSRMTISYHVRPPHPLYAGFDSRLQGLDDAALYQTLLDYETYALNLETGELDRSRPGGYSYVAQVFGRNPVVVSAQNSRRIDKAAQRVFARLGAQMVVQYHEEGADIAHPFVFVDSLLVRPSDFSITRATIVNGSDNFWWNYMTKPDAAQYKPAALLQTALAEWESHAYGRAPFITALIHENNFYRSGAEGWSSIYFTMDKGQRAAPLSPPYDLSAPDPSRLRSTAEQQAIWTAYQEMLVYAAQNLTPVTSEDIMPMAQQP